MKTKKRASKVAANTTPKKKRGIGFVRNFRFKNIGLYYTMWWKKVLVLALCVLLGFVLGIGPQNIQVDTDLSSKAQVSEYWFVLHRKSNVEILYKGDPGNERKSSIIRTFQVKSGILNERPTPLPEKLGKEYFLLTKKYEIEDNPETGRYFLELNIPVSQEEPFGPVPYEECDGQCNWVLPGAFGLHGVSGDLSRLSIENPGSSGCVRHTDSDIEYLYNLIDTSKGVRYYILNT